MLKFWPLALKLLHKNTQNLHDLQGTVLTNFRVESVDETAKIMKSAAQRYHVEIFTIGKGHKLGAPHKHVWLAPITHLNNIGVGSQNKKVMQNYATIVLQDSDKVAEETGLCRSIDTYEDKFKWVIYHTYSSTHVEGERGIITMHRIQSVVARAMSQLGHARRTGRPPVGGLGRPLSKHLDASRVDFLTRSPGKR